jgi:hypothetical protein
MGISAGWATGALLADIAADGTAISATSAIKAARRKLLETVIIHPRNIVDPARESWDGVQ